MFVSPSVLLFVCLFGRLTVCMYTSVRLFTHPGDGPPVFAFVIPNRFYLTALQLVNLYVIADFQHIIFTVSFFSSVRPFVHQYARPSVRPLARTCVPIIRPSSDCSSRALIRLSVLRSDSSFLQIVRLSVRVYPSLKIVCSSVRSSDSEPVRPSSLRPNASTIISIHPSDLAFLRSAVYILCSFSRSSVHPPV